MQEVQQNPHETVLQPIRAEVPSITSMIAVSWPSGGAGDVVGGALLPGDRRANHVHLRGRERIGEMRFAAQAGEVVHRIAGENLMPHCQLERHPQNDMTLLAPAVGGLRQMLDTGRYRPGGDVAEGPDWCAVAGWRVPLLGNPGPQVGDGGLQVFAKPVSRGAFAVHAPVVDRGDRYAQVGRQLGDVHQGFQAPRVGRRWERSTSALPGADRRRNSEPGQCWTLSRTHHRAGSLTRDGPPCSWRSPA